MAQLPVWQSCAVDLIDYCELHDANSVAIVILSGDSSHGACSFSSPSSSSSDFALFFIATRSAHVHHNASVANALKRPGASTAGGGGRASLPLRLLREYAFSVSERLGFRPSSLYADGATRHNSDSAAGQAEGLFAKLLCFAVPIASPSFSSSSQKQHKANTQEHPRSTATRSAARPDVFTISRASLEHFEVLLQLRCCCAIGCSGSNEKSGSSSNNNSPQHHRQCRAITSYSLVSTTYGCKEWLYQRDGVLQTRFVYAPLSSNVSERRVVGGGILLNPRSRYFHYTGQQAQAGAVVTNEADQPQSHIISLPHLINTIVQSQQNKQEATATSSARFSEQLKTALHAWSGVFVRRLFWIRLHLQKHNNSNNSNNNHAERTWNHQESHGEGTATRAQRQQNEQEAMEQASAASATESDCCRPQLTTQFAELAYRRVFIDFLSPLLKASRKEKTASPTTATTTQTQLSEVTEASSSMGAALELEREQELESCSGSSHTLPPLDVSQLRMLLRGSVGNILLLIHTLVSAKLLRDLPPSHPPRHRAFVDQSSSSSSNDAGLGRLLDGIFSSSSSETTVEAIFSSTSAHVSLWHQDCAVCAQFLHRFLPQQPASFHDNGGHSNAAGFSPPSSSCRCLLETELQIAREVGAVCRSSSSGSLFMGCVAFLASPFLHSLQHLVHEDRDDDDDSPRGEFSGIAEYALQKRAVLLATTTTSSASDDQMDGRCTSHVELGAMGWRLVPVRFAVLFGKSTKSATTATTTTTTTTTTATKGADFVAASAEQLLCHSLFRLPSQHNDGANPDDQPPSLPPLSRTCAAQSSSSSSSSLQAAAQLFAPCGLLPIVVVFATSGSSSTAASETNVRLLSSAIAFPNATTGMLTRHHTLHNNASHHTMFALQPLISSSYYYSSRCCLPSKLAAKGAVDCNNLFCVLRVEKSAEQLTEGDDSEKGATNALGNKNPHQEQQEEEKRKKRRGEDFFQPNAMNNTVKNEISAPGDSRSSKNKTMTLMLSERVRTCIIDSIALMLKSHPVTFSALSDACLPKSIVRRQQQQQRGIRGGAGQVWASPMASSIAKMIQQGYHASSQRQHHNDNGNDTDEDDDSEAAATSLDDRDEDNAGATAITPSSELQEASKRSTAGGGGRRGNDNASPFHTRAIALVAEALTALQINQQEEQQQQTDSAPSSSNARSAVLLTRRRIERELRASLESTTAGEMDLEQALEMLLAAVLA